MKILTVHNYYGSDAPSGENTVYQMEKALLTSRGHEVHELVRRSDRIRSTGIWGLVHGAMSTPWSWEGHRAMANAIAEIDPDIVHIHNVFPLLSPSVFYSGHEGPAKILTLHNYRLFCSAGIPMRGGKPCTLCLDCRSVMPALKYACYRGSRLATLPLAMGISLHRFLGTWSKRVTAFIALSDFQKRKMTDAGLPGRKIMVKPNFYPGNPQPMTWMKRENTVVFAGRLTEEKGVRELIAAWLQWGESAPVLEIIGDGPLMSELRSIANEVRMSRVRFTGFLSPSVVHGRMAMSKLVVLPSKCYEGFPMVIPEAFAFGTPVAVSDLGPMPGIVRNGENGILFHPGDSFSILSKIREAWMTDGYLERLAAGARDSFERLYSEEANYRILMSIYEKAIRERAR